MIVKKNELPAFVDHLKSLISEQDKEVERAVIRRGKFLFQKEFHHLQIEEATWFRMSQDQREKHLKCVVNAQVMLPNDQTTSESTTELSVSSETFQSGLKIPLQSVQAIWAKAAELLSTPCRCNGSSTRLWL